jgi:hypothetical protein
MPPPITSWCEANGFLALGGGSWTMAQMAKLVSFIFVLPVLTAVCGGCLRVSEPPVSQRDEALQRKIAETWGQPYDAMAEEKLIVLSANNEHILWEFAYSGNTLPVCSFFARKPHDRLG